jgi:hypothetical protein
MERSRPIVFLMTLLLATWLGLAACAADLFFRIAI